MQGLTKDDIDWLRRTMHDQRLTREIPFRMKFLFPHVDGCGVTQYGSLCFKGRMWQTFFNGSSVSWLQCQRFLTLNETINFRVMWPALKLYYDSRKRQTCMKSMRMPLKVPWYRFLSVCGVVTAGNYKHSKKISSFVQMAYDSGLKHSKMKNLITLHTF